jgi:transcriptional regulator of acetoin/glycerol metabolism
MTPRPDPEFARALALRVRGSMLGPGNVPPTEILDSWARSLDHGLDFAAALRLPVVESGELARRRERAAAVRRLARAELETLMQQIAGSNYLLAFADADGVVLDVVADHRFTMNCDEDIVAGSCWRESEAGTNGLGTALASGRAAAVTGAEHYFLRLADISCTASPIRDAEGRIVGLLDASSYVQERQRHTLALVQMSTAHIEDVLLTEQCAGDLLLAVHPRREFLATLSAGLLAFDAEGRLRALNARAQALLAGLDARRGVPFEALFGEPFGSFVARLHARGEARLHDRLGSAVVVRWLGRRPAASVPLAAPAAPRAPTAAPPPFVAEDARVASALGLATLALRQRMPLLIEGEPGSGKKRLVREAARAAGCAQTLHEVGAEGLDAAGLDAALAPLDGPAALLLLHGVDRLTPAPQAHLLQRLDARHDAGRPMPLAATAASELRPDLRLRLAGALVQLPALRERDDLAACARQALAYASPRAHLDPLALPLLAAQAWPGNWRELESTLARAALAALAAAAQADAPVLVGAELMRELLPAAAPRPMSDTSVLQREATERVLRELERQGGSISATARCLGVSRNTVYRHLREARSARAPLR